MNLPIIEKRKYFFAISALLTLASIVLLFVYGLKPGLDFTGGTLMELQFTGTRPAVSDMVATLAPEKLDSLVVQPAGDDGMIIRTEFLTEEEHQNVLVLVREKFESKDENGNRVLEARLETIGPSISAELRTRALKTGIIVSLAIILYIAYSFRKVSKPLQSWKYGVVAVLALLHNVLITIGVFVLLGKFKGVEVDIAFVVALLTILGASVNDTIVVFDRIREKLLNRSGSNFAHTVNIAVNETIGRSVNISLAIVLTLAALLLVGGDTIHYFSLALLIGIVVGTYSSIFVASPLLVTWEQWNKMKK